MDLQGIDDDRYLFGTGTVRIVSNRWGQIAFFAPRLCLSQEFGVAGRPWPDWPGTVGCL
jgi:hypothetical protein